MKIDKIVRSFPVIRYEQKITSKVREMNTQIILDLLARPATDVIRTLGLSEKIKRSWLMGNKLFYPGFMVKLNAVKVVELRFEKNFSNRFWQDLYEHA